MNNDTITAISEQLFENLSSAKTKEDKKFFIHEGLKKLFKKDGSLALAADQRYSSLNQIERAAEIRFASVKDLYIFLKDMDLWPFKMKADSIYKALRNGVFKGRSWKILTPSFDDLVDDSQVHIEEGRISVSYLIGVARAERTLAARVSKEKPKLNEAMEYIQGYRNYSPEPPSSSASSTTAQSTSTQDVIDVDYTEISSTTAQPASEQPALPAPSTTAQPASEEQKPEEQKPETTKPLYLETGVINTDRGALEAILAALSKTKSNSNKTELLAFRSEVQQALVSAGLLEDK